MSECVHYMSLMNVLCCQATYQHFELFRPEQPRGVSVEVGNGHVSLGVEILVRDTFPHDRLVDIFGGELPRGQSDHIAVVSCLEPGREGTPADDEGVGDGDAELQALDCCSCLSYNYITATKAVLSSSNRSLMTSSTLNILAFIVTMQDYP
eukprot:scaffold165222_cov49-Prasinocladus_malaysianus.AAC.1